MIRAFRADGEPPPAKPPANDPPRRKPNPALQSRCMIELRLAIAAVRLAVAWLLCWAACGFSVAEMRRVRRGVALGWR